MLLTADNYEHHKLLTKAKTIFMYTDDVLVNDPHVSTVAWDDLPLAASSRRCPDESRPTLSVVDSGWRRDIIVVYVLRGA